MDNMGAILERIAKRPQSTEELKRQSEESIYTPEYQESLISRSGIGMRFRDRTFENFTGPAAKVCDDYCKNIKDNMAQGKGLYLYGPCGTGKTHLLSAIAHNLVMRSVKVKLYSTVELLMDLKATFDSRESEMSVIEKINDFDLLILDDIGSEKFSEWAAQVFYLIINRRYENLQPTLFSSNLSLEELATKFNDRIASRIAGMCDVVAIKGQDRRVKCA